MPHNPTAINSWTAAQQFNSGEAATSTQYNQVVNNLSLLYAKPWLTTSINSALGSITTGTQLFTSNVTNISNSPASLAGTITNVNGTFTIPAGLSGLYRVTMRLSAIAQSTSGSFNMLCNTAGGVAGNNATFGSPRVAFNVNGGSDSMGSFVWTFSGTGTTGQYPTSMTFTTQSTATSTGYNGSAPPNYGTASTYVQIEYLGTSNGSI
jgi:hypothetical protein